LLLQGQCHCHGFDQKRLIKALENRPQVVAGSLYDAIDGLLRDGNWLKPA